MGFAPVFNIPLISDIFFLIFALKKDCNKIFILLQPLSFIVSSVILSYEKTVIKRTYNGHWVDI